MDPAYFDKKIVDCSDAELVSLGFLGENVSPDVKAFIEQIRAHPDLLGSVTCYTADCKRDSLNEAKASAQSEATQSPIKTLSALANDSDAYTVVAPDLISKYERTFYYHGISEDPPELLWRSDFATNPFPTPQPGDRFFTVPIKTANGVFGTPLNAVWDTVAPQILASIKARGLKYTSLTAVRFTINEGEEDEKRGPPVVWIAVQPGTTNAVAVRDATPEILRILADAQVTDVAVEWYEGAVERL
ncbi:hypothetical protein D9611_011381 [Ephemerocybe angulata]|uniref:Uncharacterized protein n=1 Tax=Ephemerocybe angulata TaxID=980116 RepID=A0A8H5BBC9_9AGAR|nr:hypothetical protein D9611_011381 [Tulosesus angulatus]